MANDKLGVIKSTLAYTNYVALIASTVPIIWVSAMVVHDFIPDSTFRKLLSNLLSQTFNYWPYILILGALGFILAVFSFLNLRKYFSLVVGVIALLVSGFMYFVIYAVSNSGI